MLLNLGLDPNHFFSFILRIFLSLCCHLLDQWFLTIFDLRHPPTLVREEFGGTPATIYKYRGQVPKLEAPLEHFQGISGWEPLCKTVVLLRQLRVNPCGTENQFHKKRNLKNKLVAVNMTFKL